MCRSLNSDGKEGGKQYEMLENVLKLPSHLSPASLIHHRSCSNLFSGFLRVPACYMFFLVKIAANSDSSVSFLNFILGRSV